MRLSDSESDSCSESLQLAVLVLSNSIFCQPPLNVGHPSLHGACSSPSNPSSFLQSLIGVNAALPSPGLHLVHEGLDQAVVLGVGPPESPPVGFSQGGSFSSTSLPQL